MSNERTTELRQEVVRCRACSGDVEVSVLYVDGQRSPQLPVTCSPCSDKEDAELSSVGMAAPAAPRDHRDWLRSLGVNTRKHGDATFDNFEDGESPLAKKAAMKFAQELVAAGKHDRVRGIYLTGAQTGVGKSHLAVAIMRYAHDFGGRRTVVYDSADRLITKVQDSYGHGATDSLIDVRAQADLYVLDDMGREKPTADALRVLATILDEREGAPTVITSNYDPKELGRRHGNEVDWGRVASRLGDEVYRYVLVTGRDRRFRNRGG